MTYDAHFRVWRGDSESGELVDYPVEVNEGEVVRKELGVGLCNITKCCTEVCPEHIKITDNAIIPMKERVVDRRYDPLVWLGKKIFRRDQIGA